MKPRLQLSFGTSIALAMLLCTAQLLAQQARARVPANAQNISGASNKSYTGYSAIEEIPLPEGCKYFSNDFLKSVPQLLREELAGKYLLDGEKLGRFKTFAAESRRCFSFQSADEAVFGRAEAFYKKLFNLAGAYRCNDGYCGFDLRTIQEDKSTEVREVSSDAGGCLFEWMFLKGNKLTHLSVVIPGWGNQFQVFETVYADGVPCPPVPAAEELQFPSYPGSVFCPQKSTEVYVLKVKNLTKRTIVFETTDGLEKVVSFFTSAIKKQDDDPLYFLHQFQKNKEKGNWYCMRYLGKAWESVGEDLPRLNVEFRPAQYRNSKLVTEAYTSIEYSYLSSYSPEDLKRLLDYENE